MGGDETVAYSGFGAQGVGGVHAHYRWECCKLAHRERLHVFPIHLWVNPLYVNHFWLSHLQVLMQLLTFVCFKKMLIMPINNFNGLRSISS